MTTDFQFTAAEDIRKGDLVTLDTKTGALRRAGGQRRRTDAEFYAALEQRLGVKQCGWHLFDPVDLDNAITAEIKEGGWHA